MNKSYSKKTGLKISIILGIIILSLGYNCFAENRIVKIDKETNRVIKYLGYENCYLLKLGNCGGLTNQECIVTKAEVENHIKSEMEKYMEKIPVQNRRTVEKGDYVLVSYDVYYEKSLISSAADHVIHVGNNEYDVEFEKNMVGAKLGDIYEMKWHVPNDSDVYGDYKELIGEIVDIKLKVKEIYDIKEQKLTDTFVRNTLGYNDIDEYKSAVYDMLKTEKAEIQIAEQKQTLIQNIIDTSKFCLNEEIVVENAADIYEEYNYEAYLLDMSLEDYAELYLDIPMDKLYDKAYEDSEKDIGWYLVIGGIAAQKHIDVNEPEMEQYVKEKGQEFKCISEEDWSYIYYNILEKKVMDTIYEEYQSGKC